MCQPILCDVSVNGLGLLLVAFGPDSVCLGRTDEPCSMGRMLRLTATAVAASPQGSSLAVLHEQPPWNLARLAPWLWPVKLGWLYSLLSCHNNHTVWQNYTFWFPSAVVKTFLKWSIWLSPLPLCVDAVHVGMVIAHVLLFSFPYHTLTGTHLSWMCMISPV